MTAAEPADPMSDEAAMGPLSSASAAETLQDQLDRAVAQGAEIVAGGDRKDNYFSSTVLVGVSPDNDAYREEFFGPVASVYRVGSEEEAIEVANATPFGLGSYVFADDPEQAQRVADALDTGMVYVNGVGARRRRAAVRRRQALGLRPRARPVRHRGVRQQEADPRGQVAEAAVPMPS